MTQTFSTLTLKLLQGHIIDDITEPALMNWLDDESNFASLQDYLAKINRQVLFTNDKRGAYLGFIELYDKDSSQAIRQSFSQISLTLFPLILWLRLVRGVTDSSRPLQAGDNIHLSELLASIESSKQLELQLADIISKIGRQTKEAKKQLYSLVDYLENTGYLHPTGSNGMIYKATAKWSLLYDQLEYLAKFQHFNQDDDSINEQSHNGYQSSLDLANTEGVEEVNTEELAKESLPTEMAEKSEKDEPPLTTKLEEGKEKEVIEEEEKGGDDGE